MRLSSQDSNIGCNCPDGYCVECVEPTTDCVYYMSRFDTITIEKCPIGDCKDSLGTWHKNGKCMRHLEKPIYVTEFIIKDVNIC